MLKQLFVILGLSLSQVMPAIGDAVFADYSGMTNGDLNYQAPWSG